MAKTAILGPSMQRFASMGNMIALGPNDSWLLEFAPQALSRVQQMPL